MNTFGKRELLQLITRICKADSLSESFALYRDAAPLLTKCKFVFAAKSGGIPGFAVKRTFSSGAAVRSLFSTDKVIVLDKDTFREMEKGTTTYGIDYSIMLDTQAVSYLEPFLCGSVSRLPKDFKEVFEFIAREDVSVDSLLYLLENFSNLDCPNAADRIFGKWKAYETLRTLDSEWLKTREEVRSTLSDEELIKRAQEQVGKLFMDRTDDGIIRRLNFRQQVMYCLLLKMVSIQLHKPRSSVVEKMRRFLQFLDSELATMFMRESVIARAYFERGQRLTFFGKIQENKPDLFTILNGMAWDLLHVRQLEEAMTFRPSRGARYFFPALLTFDKRLTEIIDLHPLRAFALIEGSHETYPFYDGDLLKVLCESDDDADEFIKRFYSTAAQSSRETRKLKAKGQLGKIILELEDEVSGVAAVSKRETQRPC